MPTQLATGDRVVFLGWRSDARGLMQSANAFIQASAYEGYGIALIEAARRRAYQAVNTELVAHYWELGVETRQFYILAASRSAGPSESSSGRSDRVPSFARCRPQRKSHQR